MAVAIPQKSEMPHYNQSKFVLAQPRVSHDLPGSRLSCERQVLGRRSIEARRLSPVTSSEYMQVGSRYSIKSSIELDPSIATTRFSQASSMEPLSHHVRYPSPTGHIPSVPIANNTFVYPSTLNQINQGVASKHSIQSKQLSNQPVIPARKRSRNPANQIHPNFNGLPPISDDVPCAPMMINSSRFSTSPGRPARSRIVRPPVPRIPELFSSRRPSLDQFRPKKRFATSIAQNESSISSSDNSSSTPPSDTTTQTQTKSKQSFSNLRKMMGGGGNQTAKSRFATSSPDSTLDQLQKYSGFAQHHAQRMGARTPPMPVTIEVAPYEYATEIEPSPKTTALPDHVRFQAKEGNHRDTLLIRGSWVDFAKCTEEVESAKNGKSKTWWSRLIPKKRAGTRRTSLASLSEDKPLECRRAPSPSLPEGRMSLMDFFKDEMQESRRRQSEDQRSLPPPFPLPLPPKKRSYNDDSTQKTVGSSILYLDETLNRPIPVGMHCASPEQMSPPTCQTVSSISQTAPLNLKGKKSVPFSTIDFPIDSPATIAFPRTPVTEDHCFDNSFTSTMDATDVLYDLLSQFKNESSPSTITSNSQTTNRSRPVPSSVMLPEFEMVTPQTLQQSTTTEARTRSITNKSIEIKMNRATCTTMETIMSYQSSEDSPLSSLVDGDEVMQASQDFTVEADASGGASAFLNDLIDGIQHDISVSSRSVLNSHSKRYFDSSAPPSCFGHHLKPAASHSTMDSAYSGFAWPLRENPSPSFRMMGASIVARELKMSDARRFDDSPCPGSRVAKVKRDEESEKNHKATFNTDLTVSHVLVPDISLQHSPIPSRPTNPISAQCDTSAGQTPPKIIVDRPQSDSSMSLQSINSPSKCDDAVIQRASVVRKSSASILDFSSVRMSMDVFGSVVEGKRCRISSMKAKAVVPMLPSPHADWDTYGSPVSSRSPSQSPNLSFAWSGKRFSSSTGYTVPSPIPRNGSGGIDSQKSSFGADPFITRSKSEQIDESILTDITDLRGILSLLRESKERFPDSEYSRVLMETFIAPQTPQQIKQFLHQSRVAFIPLNHEGLPSPDLQVVEIVEGREPYDGKRWTQPHKIGRTSKRHLMKRMRSNVSGSNNSALSFGDSSFVSQIGKDSEADTSSGDVDMTAFSTTFVDEDLPRCMNDTSAMTSFSSQPQQSSPLARKASILSNESSDISEQTLSPDPEEKVNDARTNWQPFNQLWSPPQSMIPLSAAMLDAHGQLTRQESIRPRRLSNIKIVIQSPSTRSSVTSPRSC
ncbi:uncharacterized protein FA14DRAFT_184890 [Meira miltonrushii]|uniref:Uncharacterized protein n=1 Tax=Meira miltonrushii TaxID=1280837 RepID=A0A316VFB8_9BASI|nr:uncharacterized protein FA14DRAFT_184890 [Meira miltonrushii]PWN36327.1 hypothetical protein FA14DRAFT_184890 [Meira miltonrushii]